MKGVLKKRTKFRIKFNRFPKDKDELKFWNPNSENQKESYIDCRRCRYCKRRFTPHRIAQKYCTYLCTTKAWKKRKKEKLAIDLI